MDSKEVFQTIQQRVRRGAKIYTDGFKMYRGLLNIGYEHAFVDHLQNEYVRDDIHTNNIEGFWGILKRKLSCIGGMRHSYLPFFVGEIVWRFNHRTFSLQEQERELWKLVIGN